MTYLYFSLTISSSMVGPTIIIIPIPIVANSLDIANGSIVLNAADKYPNTTMEIIPISTVSFLPYLSDKYPPIITPNIIPTNRVSAVNMTYKWDRFYYFFIIGRIVDNSIISAPSNIPINVNAINWTFYCHPIFILLFNRYS